ncbi:knob-associated histidine-rich protein [Plasmodium brasilianum]|uniref:Knob-associated histidine-rich protein n=1 Tax=Plasmodium brasilianum TaxID=5824 RepID=A0ACB9Y4T9_PLABR|nr:knob-associated histidine-rich protein [Plasmodium brasilianum]
MRKNINILFYFVKICLFSILTWILRCSNYFEDNKGYNKKNNTQGPLNSRTNRLLAEGGKKKKASSSPVKKTNIIKEVIHSGYKEYQERYDIKRHKIVQDEEKGFKDCDETYEGSNYGFTDKRPYTSKDEEKVARTKIYSLKKRFPFYSISACPYGTNKSIERGAADYMDEYDDDDDDDSNDPSNSSATLLKKRNIKEKKYYPVKENPPTVVRKYIRKGNAALNKKDLIDIVDSFDNANKEYTAFCYPETSDHPYVTINYYNVEDPKDKSPKSKGKKKKKLIKRRVFKQKEEQSEK